ncbi:MAG: molybdate transport system permease protein [Myxococcales bacterium]|nr:molybdate transport system permease protein [Myxococcales bacterium]
MNEPPLPGGPLARRVGRWAAALPAAVALSTTLAVFLVLPTVALIVGITPGGLRAGLSDQLVAPALALSLTTSGIALLVVVVCGTPLAWWLGRTRSRTARWIETALQLPAVIPPAVAGIALLLTFGRRGLVGAGLNRAGLGVAFTAAAVVMAQVFVAAPFYLQAATAAFGRLDVNMLAVARSLGASPARVFFLIGLPLARPGLVAGAAMSWARALGEFGATLMFAGNMVGRTQTLPLAIYSALESDLRTAQALSVILVVVAFGLLVIIRRLQTGKDVAPM